MNGSKKLHWFFSISTAVIIYALLLVIFIPVKLDLTVKEDNGNKITMLPVSGNLTQHEKDLVAWMNNENPTLIVLPSRKYNYSQVLANKIEFNFDNRINDLFFLKNIEDDLFKNIKISKISMTDISNVEKTEKYELYSYPTLPTYPLKIPTVNVSYPCFRDYYTGEIFPIKFPESIKIADLVKKEKPQTYTMLSVKSASKIGLFPYVRIIKSCGNDELDKLALINVVTQATADTKFFNSGRELKIVVEWQK
jgi:hypothetical protein